MSRKQRIHFFNATYHVMHRGNFKQAVFTSDDDRLFFLKLLEEAKQQYDCKIHLFCLMSNHTHLVIEVMNATLSKIMQKVMSGYAKYHNKRLQRFGHVFQGRHKAILVQSNNYLMELCYYIHQNPIAAKMVTHLDDYHWSSHLSYAGKLLLPWLTTSRINNVLSNQYPNHVDFYGHFMANHKNENLDPDFFELQIEQEIQQPRPLPEIKLPIQTIIRIVASNMNIAETDLYTGCYSRKAVLARSMIAYFAHYHSNYYLKDIAYILNRNPVNLSRRLHKTLKKAQSEPAIVNLMALLKRQLHKETLMQTSSASSMDT